ncbi:hypothetical protein BGP_0288 [Beggiatoa sp. PS]|nr:hypothetical protein BGP_0288 [Beggiatoa sp. PS]
MTATKARKTTIKFGFAVKYQIGESEQYESFFKTKKHRLRDVLLAKD